MAIPGAPGQTVHFLLVFTSWEALHFLFVWASGGKEEVEGEERKRKRKEMGVGVCTPCRKRRNGGGWGREEGDLKLMTFS